MEKDLREIRKIEPRDFVKVAQLENENWTLASTPHVMDSSAEKIIGKIMTGTTYFLAVENDEILEYLITAPATNLNLEDILSPLAL